MVSRPLEGLRVLDLTRFVAGSYTTALLAAFGAEVLKLEVPPGGDPYRVQGTERLGDESVLFLSLNSGKRSVALDFRSPSAADALERLLGSSQFLVENGRPGSLARHGLDWEQVHARWPSIVYGSISGYGDVGPDAARGGFDLILQAESGIMSVTGQRGLGPRQGGRPGARCRRRAQLCGRSPRRTRGAGTHGDRDPRVVFVDGVRAVEPRHPRRRDVRLGPGAGLAGHALTDVRPLRRLPDRGRVDRPRGGRVRGPVGALLQGARRGRVARGPEVRGQRGAGPSPRRSDGGVRGDPADPAQRGLARAARRRRGACRGGPGRVAGLLERADRGARRGPAPAAPECRRVRGRRAARCGSITRCSPTPRRLPPSARTPGPCSRRSGSPTSRSTRSSPREPRSHERGHGCARGRRRAPHDRALGGAGAHRRRGRSRRARPLLVGGRRPRRRPARHRRQRLGSRSRRRRTGPAVVRAPGYGLRSGRAARGADTRRCAARSERRRRLGRRGGAVRGRVLARTGLDARVVALDRRRGGPREPPRGDLRARGTRGGGRCLRRRSRGTTSVASR